MAVEAELYAVMIYTVLVAAAVGIIPALVARNKGRSAFVWWLFGTALALVAIPAVFLVDDLTKRKCRECGESIKRDARRCRYCGYNFAPQGEPDF